MAGTENFVHRKMGNQRNAFSFWYGIAKTNAFETSCLSSSHLCSSIKFCQPAKIIYFGHPNVGLVDGHENEEKSRRILIANQSKYVDSEVQFCQL